jgi:hypothetical protein
MGGRTCVYGGYVWEFVPGHRLQNLWGFVSQHRLVAENKIGRGLMPGDHVHHLDGNRQNNDPNNLEVMTMKEHRQLHYQQGSWGSVNSSRAPITYEMVQQALEGRTLKAAALLLHVDTMTLRNRFPDLINVRKRKSPVKIDETTVSKAISMMKSGKYLAKEICKLLGIGQVTLVRIGKKHFVSPRWKKNSKVGELRKSYRGKPTLRWLIESGQRPELADQLSLPYWKRLPKRLYQDEKGTPV